MNKICTLVCRAFILLSIGLFSLQLNAQVITIGAGASSGTASNGATGDSGPMYRSSNTSDFVYSRYHYLYTAAELAAAGVTPGMNITVIAWNKDNVSATNSPATFQIWMKNSSKTIVGPAGQLWADLISGSTQVYNNTALTIASPAAWQEFTLNSPFLYTGGALEISANFDISSGTSPWTTAGISWKRDAITDRTLSYVGNTAPGTTLPNLRTVRPQVQLTLSPSGPCTTPPAAGQANSSATAAICAGTPVSLSLTGNSSGSGQTYQWQSSATQNGTYTDVGTSSASPSLTISPTVSRWYRAKVSCSGQDAFSAPVEVVVNPAFAAGTYTINNTQPTSGTNYNSFNDAVNAIKCGITGAVVFNVAPGTGPYTEQVNIPQIAGATAVSTVTFNGNGVTLSSNSSDANNRTGIVLNGADHIIIDSLNIDVSQGTYGWGVLLTNQADSNIIRKCTITTNASSTSTNYLGILLNGSATATATSGNNANGNLIEKNTVVGGYYSIMVYGSTAPYNNNNVIRNNAVQDFYTYGIYLYGNNNVTVTGNDIARPARTAVTTTYSIYVSTNTSVLVEKNRVHNLFDAVPANASTAYGVYIVASGVSAAAPNRVENNAFYNFNNGAGAEYGIYGPGYNNYNYYHNSINFDDQAATAGTTYGIYAYGTAINVKNNIVSISRGGTGTKYCLYYNTVATGVTSSNNNVLYMNSAAGTNNIGFYGSAYSTFAAWQAVYDQQSLNVDPMFVNASAGDLTPQAAIINNKGANVGVTTDILNNPRSVASPDPGAFEFSLGGCVNPPTPGAATTVSTMVCPNTSFTLSLTGNSEGDNQFYQWQTSTNNTTWTNIGTASTSSVFTTSQTANTYYRAAVTCNGGTTVYSTSILVTSPSLVSGTFTIDNTQPTGGTNFQSFGDAINFVKCGISGPVVFNVTNNVYAEQVTIPAIGGASATNTITINCHGATLSYNTTDAANRTALVLNGADHVIIDSLNIDVSQGTYGWGILLTGQADSNIIRKCTIVNNTSTTSTNYMGIIINGSGSTTAVTGNNANGNLITRNSITGGYYGVYVYGSTTSYNKGNTFSNNLVQEMYSYGFYLYGNDSLTVSANEITRPSRSAVTTTYCIYVSTNTRVLVEKNRIHNLFDAATTSTSSCYPIYIVASGASATTPGRVENNLIYNINNGAGLIYGIYGASYNNWNYYHNTIVLDDAGATTGTTYGIYVYGTAVNVKNNIVSIARGGTGTKYNLYYSTTGVTTSNNNLLINTSGSGTNGVGYYNAGATTLAAWQAANSAVYDQASYDIDPVFANPGAGDFTPTSSLVNNKGAAVGVATDIVNAVRDNSTPDMGAYEFSTLTAGINMGAEGLVSPQVSSKGCYTSSETAVVKVRNNSLSTINFATNPVTVTVTVSGAATQTITTTVNSGTLASDGTMNITLSQPLNLGSAGAYTISASTSVAGDVNTSNDAMLPKTLTKETLTAGAVSAAPESYCAPSPISPTLSTAGGIGYSDLQWKESLTSNGSYTNIAGATTPSYTLAGAITQTKYYKLFATCGAVVDSSSAVTVAYNNPQVLATTPGTRCGAGSVTLGATASSGVSLNWYAAATGGSALGSGASFTTPSISANTTYYVAAGSGASSQYVGAPNLSIGAPLVVGSYYVNFTVLNTTTIQAVECYFSTLGAAFTLNIRNASTQASVFTYSGTVSVTGTTTPQVLPLNATLAPGDYQMGWTTDPGTYRVSTGGAYPYTVPGVISITGNTFNDPAYYYYFFHWLVSTGCESARTAVLARTDDCPVPVTLLNFKGERQGSVNKLEWTTSTEINNVGFELQRSADGSNFSKLTFVASRAVNGNSSSPIAYNFDDAKPMIGNGYYRLKQIDKDGKATYSNVVLLKGAKVTAITFSNVYPNPVKNRLNAIVTAPANGDLNIVITDLSGKMVMQRLVQAVTGDNQVHLQVDALAAGTYILKAVCANGCESAVHKFVKE